MWIRVNENSETNVEYSSESTRFEASITRDEKQLKNECGKK